MGGVALLTSEKNYTLLTSRQLGFKRVRSASRADRMRLSPAVYAVYAVYAVSS